MKVSEEKHQNMKIKELPSLRIYKHFIKSIEWTVQNVICENA